MPKRAVDRIHTALAILGHLIPAWLVFGLAAVFADSQSLVLLLIANAVAMTGICRALGFDMDAGYPRSLARRGLAYFILLTVYTAFVAVLLAAPALWLSRDGSLPAALVLSATLFVAVFSLWRVWPTFALPFVWDDAYPHDDDRGSWLSTALRRSLAFARHLTREHELFVGYGFPAGLALLLLAAGALSLAGLGNFIAGEVRVVGFAVYAVVVAPLAHIVLVNRTLRALLADARVARRRETSPSVPAAAEDASDAALLPPGISRAELDATLLCAAHSSQVDLAMAALERGADPNAVPGVDLRDQRSALMVAATLPDLRLLRTLIAKGVDVNRAQGGITPLLAVTRDSYQGRPDAVMTLLANGADARMADAAGNTPLHHAARCAEPGIAALLLDAAADVDAVNAEGTTALAIACGNANWKVAAFLLERGAKPDVERAQPALLLAAGIAEDDPAGVKLLLKQRANPDARGAFERTPLMAAALAGHARIVEALLAGNASPDLADQRGTTALMEAARSGTVAAIYALGKRKANPDAVDGSGRSALIVACQSRHASEETVRALLSLGADRALAGADGKRALDHAAAAGRWHVVALLDPAYPLPSSLGVGAPPAHGASADHLLDALRFGHWNVAAEFTGVLTEWPTSALADLYFDLADPEHADARAWLLNRGLGGDAATGEGRPLVDALVDALPNSAAALAQWLQHGAPTGGAGLFARVLAQAPLGAEGEEMRALAASLIERGADWCGRAGGQRSALHLAAAQGDLALTGRLLERGADPNARDAQGRTPLHAVLKLDAERALPLLQRLLVAGADPEIATANGETPLGLALAREERTFVRWLSWTQWRLPGRPLRADDLPAAAAIGDLDAVERLLALGLPLEAEDAKGATALIRAAGNGHAALAVRLLESGADPAHVSRSGMHCLAAAVAAQRESIVRTLLSHGVASDTRLAGGGTALMIAAAIGQRSIVEALLEAGANANAADDQGATALHAAAQYAFDHGDTAAAHALLDRLLRAGAQLDARNHAGQDALLILLGSRSAPGSSCDAEHLARLTELLLGYGAKLDTQDQRGVGALHACALHGLLGCARMLKVHGASLDLVDGFGRTAADVASLLGYTEVAAELGAAHLPLPSARQTLRRPARTPD
ncbi:ankyrin repeat domain-containing protein [Dokdonella sp.]|uniref:ankyrin repeat domain-containing protein n=1 Tax=Dokdonella sp. TaxID=2291710 RepID=UPI001B086177|nr:ankyrin repeat domain-containing protein [Dokdonella sp.]MBO9664493.1 ankyrin repeat domain-containing protein [Dokdonella sp.]